MDYFSLKPTEENINVAFKEDLLQRNNDLFNFIQILDHAEYNFTVSLDGPWGSGKTFFVKQAVALLNHSNELYRKEHQISENDIYYSAHKRYQNRTTSGLIHNDHLAIYYDAWANDNNVDPVMSLLFQIANQLGNQQDLDVSRRTKDALTQIAESLLILTGKKDIANILEAVNSLDEMLKVDNLTDGEAHQNSINQQIEKFFNELHIERATRIDLFIDELDRCTPTYAVQLLERIKHYFQSSNISFIFSTNLYELSNTLRCYYGHNFNSVRYLDRFFDLRFSLHKPNDIRRLLKSISYNQRSVPEIYAQYYAEKLNLELRELINYMKTVQLITSRINSSWMSDSDMYICLGVLLPLLLALKICNFEEYSSIMNGTGSQAFARLVSKIDIFEAKRNFYPVLLKNDESYEIEPTNSVKKHVTCYQKVEELYEALFPLHQHYYKDVKIGQIVISTTAIDELSRGIALLSSNISFNIMHSNKE